MGKLWLFLLLVICASVLCSAARNSARFISTAAVAGPEHDAAVQSRRPHKYNYHDDAHESYHPKTDEPRYKSSEHTDRAYFSSEKHVITLEMLKHNGDGQATRQVQLQQSANSTGLNLGLVCSQKSSEYGYNDIKYDPYGSDEDDDMGPLIKGNPTPLEQIGHGKVDIKWSTDQRTVEIERQRGLQVATVTGEFDAFEDGASCNPLLTRKASISFNDVPIYAMVTRVNLPLDPSVLKRLLPFASGQPSNPSPTLPNLPGGLLPDIPGGLPAPGAFPVLPASLDNTVVQQQETKGNAFIKSGSSEAQIGVASASVAGAAAAAVSTESHYQEDQTLCGLTLVAKGSAKLRGTGDQTFSGSVESALLWTNGIITLPGYMAEAVAASSGQSTESLFSTTVNQVLTSTVYNGVSSALLQTLVGNSAFSTAVDANSRAASAGGNVNLTIVDNVVSSNSDNATMVAGDSVSGNAVNVYNRVGSAMEQYMKLLKTMCKHHKDIPDSKPETIRFDLTALRSGPEDEQEEPAETDSVRGVVVTGTTS